uniref:LolToxB n=1 Tax=Bichromomyia olmeca TaxID=715919 RepID=A0A1B1V3G6_9DIPT|nr:LolToxB [Bichromomyia olmeca]
MDPKYLLILCLLIAAVAASPSSLPDDHSGSLMRTKRAVVRKEGCRYMFGGCGETEDCCAHLACHSWKYCAWDWTL